jgi:hypothetical protein
LVDVRKRHAGALFIEGADERRTNAGGSSCDENTLPVKAWILSAVLHLVIPCFWL